MSSNNSDTGNGDPQHVQIVTHLCTGKRPKDFEGGKSKVINLQLSLLGLTEADEAKALAGANTDREVADHEHGLRVAVIVMASNAFVINDHPILSVVRDLKYP